MSIFSELFGCTLFDSIEDIQKQIAIENFYRIPMKKLIELQNILQKECAKEAREILEEK